MESLLKDIQYALAQCRRAKTYRSMSIMLDCNQRAIDALERAEEALVSLVPVEETYWVGAPDDPEREADPAWESKAFPGEIL
jgi:hypothetical protein